VRYLGPWAVALLLLVGCTTDPLPGYRAATADERASILATVSEYYDIWNRAMVTADVTPLYVRHPKLAQGAVPQRGINNEGQTVRLPSVADLKIKESRVDIESYEPLRAFIKGDSAVAYSHGSFTWTYPDGAPSGGELLVRFDMTRVAGAWSIDQTDEWVLGEGAPSPTPR
jgi:hypothetical protein